MEHSCAAPRPPSLAPWYNLYNMLYKSERLPGLYCTKPLNAKRFFYYHAQPE